MEVDTDGDEGSILPLAFAIVGRVMVKIGPSTRHSNGTSTFFTQLLKLITCTRLVRHASTHNLHHAKEFIVLAFHRAIACRAFCRVLVELAPFKDTYGTLWEHFGNTCIFHPLATTSRPARDQAHHAFDNELTT